MSSEGRRCYLHIGFQKTGTTYLQTVFWQSKEDLRQQGLEMLTDSFRDTSHLMFAVRGLLSESLHPPRAFTVMGRLAEQAASSTADRALISQETLAPATPEQIQRLLGLVPDHEVHVVVTVRDIARQLPSVWQERVKSRITDPYGIFLEDVVRRGPAAGQFWKVHDLPDVLGRWGAAVGRPDRVHVVTVPQRGAAPGLLLERFCRALDVDPQTLDRDTGRSNTSIGMVQAELMRRVNLALGDRLPIDEPGYGVVGKRLLGEDVLAAQRGHPPRLPRSMEDWCRRTAENWRDTVVDRGYQVVGDLDDLLPDPSVFADELPDVSEAELLDASTEALATMLDRVHEERQETRGLRQELRAAERELRQTRRALRGRNEPGEGGAATPSLLTRAVSRAVRGRR